LLYYFDIIVLFYLCHLIIFSDSSKGVNLDCRIDKNSSYVTVNYTGNTSVHSIYIKLHNGTSRTLEPCINKTISEINFTFKCENSTQFRLLLISMTYSWSKITVSLHFFFENATNVSKNRSDCTGKFNRVHCCLTLKGITCLKQINSLIFIWVYAPKLQQLQS